MHLKLASVLVHHTTLGMRIPTLAVLLLSKFASEQPGAAFVVIAGPLFIATHGDRGKMVRYSSVSSLRDHQTECRVTDHLPSFPVCCHEWGLCEYVIVHMILGGSPVILWISLGGKPKWLPLKFGYHDVMRTSPISSASRALFREPDETQI